MASVKVKLRSSSAEAKEGVLVYQITVDKVTRCLPTGYKLHSGEWDPVRSRILLSSGIDERRREYLISLSESISRETEKLFSIIARCDRSGESYTVDKVVEKFCLEQANMDFLSFARRLIFRFEQLGKIRLGESYRTTVNSLTRFHGTGEIPFEEFDSNLMVAYQTWLKARGLCQNSISYYMRNLRAIYNRAVEKNLILQANPFKHVYTGVDKTIKRAVSLNAICKLRSLDLSGDQWAEYARDMFLFSFYMRGMSFVDMAYLKKKDLSHGILSYCRRKTGQRLFVKWERPMQEIVDKYDTSSSAYMLPIIRDAEKDERKQYRYASHLVNEQLHKIGQLLGLPIPLTCYVARHTWASIALSENVPVSIISEAMGHDSEKTTRIYLATLDRSKVDNANARILNAVRKNR